MSVNIRPTTSQSIVEGRLVTLEAQPSGGAQNDYTYKWSLDGGVPLVLTEPIAARTGAVVTWDTTGLRPGNYKVLVTAELTSSSSTGSPRTDNGEFTFTIEPRSVTSTGATPVTMQRTLVPLTEDVPLWVVIRKTTEALSFQNYLGFMDLLLCNPPSGASDIGDAFAALRGRRFLPFNDTDAYRLLKIATEAFLAVNGGITLSSASFANEAADLARRLGTAISAGDLSKLWNDYLETVNGTSDQTLPYLALVQSKLKDAALKNSIFPVSSVSSRAPNDPTAAGAGFPEKCVGILRAKLTQPFLLELIWSYWHEQGMLVQTMNAISLRFQNVRGAGQRDPLQMLNIDPLRPLSNLLWGYLQDEQHRLSVVRRGYEYSSHYGFTLEGKAIQPMRPADNRSKFIEAFHNLLYLSSVFFKEDDDTTVIADGFPVLNALKDVHFLLSEGAHNQFGDLPSTARQEMLIQQWLLARPEFREFLPTRVMVAYPEPWMDRVDAMKNLQGWTDTSVLHFRNLGVFGEQLLLSIRYGAWSDANDRDQAANWARYWRSEVQGYTHAYRAVTGVDLTAEASDPRQMAARNLQPSAHLRQRWLMQRNRQPERAGQRV